MNLSKSVRTVLCVEDDKASGHLVRAVLEEKGYACLWARHAGEGLRLALRHHVDLLLLDLGLPGVDGIELLRMLRELSVPAPVIVISAHATPENALTLGKLGVRKFVVKPIRRRDLLDEVANAMPETSLTYPLLGTPQGTTRQPPKARQDAPEGLRRELDQAVAEQQAAKRQAAELDSRLETLQRELMGARQEAEQVKESLVGSARALLGILDNRETFSGSHGARVADLALKIATRLGIPEGSLHYVEIAGLLHDIGKITLPEHVLGKEPEQMTAEERRAYVRHPEAGQVVIEHMVAGGRVAEIVRAHHERHDGTGFPDGLATSAVPLEARIIAAADAADRALHHRTPDEPDIAAARDRLRRLRGSALDPVITDHALTVLDELEEFWATHRAVAVDVYSLVGGETLAQDVRSTDGLLYLPRGAVITEGYRSRLRRLAHDGSGTFTVKVYEPAGVPTRA